MLSGAGSFELPLIRIQFPPEVSCYPHPQFQPFSLPSPGVPPTLFRGQLPVTCPSLLRCRHPGGLASSCAAAAAGPCPSPPPGPRLPASPRATPETEAPRDSGLASPRAGSHREGGAGAVATTTSGDTSSSGGECGWERL